MNISWVGNTHDRYVDRMIGGILLLAILSCLQSATPPSVLPSAMYEGVNFNSPLAIITHMKQVSSSPKTHKQFLKRVLHTAASTNNPALIQEFFKHITGHHVYAFQSALWVSLQNAAELGNKDVVEIILQIDRDRFNNQLLLSSDLVELAVKTGLAENYDILSTIMDNLSNDNARQVIMQLSQTPEYAQSSMLQVVLANKSLLIDIASGSVNF